MGNVGAMSKQYLSALTQNPDYLVHIKCAGMGLEIVADMPEEVTTAVGSEWEAILPSAVGDYSDLVGKVAKVSGNNAVASALTKQVWVNSSPIEFPISLLFKATSDPKNEVVDPMRVLEMLAMPATYGGILSGAANAVGGLLVSPGPNRGKVAGGDLSLELIVGKQLHFDSCIIVNVSSTFSSRLHNGYPIAGRSDITFRSDHVLSREEWAIITSVSI